MDGEICEPKANVVSGQAYWKPTEELCVHAGPGAGIGSVAYSPNVPFENVPSEDGSGDTLTSRIQRVTGMTYRTTAVNNNAGGFGTVAFNMNSYSAATLYSLEAQPTAATHKFYYGTFARPGAMPFGMYTPGTSVVDMQKGQDLLDLGVQMTRTNLSTLLDDSTGFGGGYQFTADDPLLYWLFQHSIVPLIEIDAGAKLYGTLSQHSQEPLMRNPTEFGNFCAAAASHLHATYPQLGVTVPAYFSMPANELNNSGNWDASRSDNPSLYSEAAGGPALYMHSCYGAIKQVFPTAKVYVGELSTNVAGAPNAMPNELSRWYANGCRIGTCFDGVSLHISPIGDPSKHFTRCYEPNDGWTFACVNEMQAISTQNGDPLIHALITETDLSSIRNANISAGDEPGQAWWESETLSAAAQNPYIDGVFWANVDEDALYPSGSQFYGASLIDTSGSAERRKPAFYTYCRFAKFPESCSDPLAPSIVTPRR